MDAQTATALAILSDRVENLIRRISALERNVEIRIPEPYSITWSTGSSVAAGSEVELTVVLPMWFSLARVTTSAAARLRLYDRAAKSTADASRASGVYPSGDHGLLFELDGGSAAEDVTFSPRIVATNRDGSTSYKLRVKNRGGSATVITGSIWIV